MVDERDKRHTERHQIECNGRNVNTTFKWEEVINYSHLNSTLRSCDFLLCVYSMCVYGYYDMCVEVQRQH